ncbi:alanine racemase [Thermosipho africanus Ob7]|jgi:alanine racemase|uniref:Alanine racemase n=1 Tax=Thermosipho africanus (strain TCF52B) TaxID=484019 RepID=B7ICM4_THEAB|nr:alanine racemase [Thermosipho africanus]ACJ75751.1 alr alanine racemase [Thermosipho africanus TCF52B]RDI91436.1 alanine racemase [Thermosipho africanus Ob7]
MGTESRRTFAEININNYIENLKYFQKKCSPAKVMPVIKANAYGHGAVMLAKSAEKMGIDYFAVAFLEEALILRKNGINTNILVFNYLDKDFVPLAADNNITITIISNEQVEEYKDLIKKPKVHINIDTGMNRVGIEPKDAMKIYEKLISNGFEVEGIYTHFAVADSLKKEDIEFTKKQYEKFLEVNLPVKIRHTNNSAASLSGIISCGDYVRIGIASYGLMPSNQVKDENLKPVLTWKSVVSHVKTLKKGESVSYGRTFVAPYDMKVATIPVGYADGYWRHLSNNGEVLINGKRRKILGRVCMDQFVVEADDEVKIGDEVILIGKQGNEFISAEEIADKVGTINYEVTCRISERVPRIYKGVEL